MSIVNYLGCNFKVEVTDEKANEWIGIGYFFSNESNRKNVLKKHMSTLNVYEIELPNPIWQLHDDLKKFSPRKYHKSLNDLMNLCNMFKKLLNPGEYCEIYPCWIDEELEPKEADCIIRLDDYRIDEIEIFEKCLVRIER